MNDDRPREDAMPADIESLAGALLADDISDSDRDQLEQLITSDPAIRRAYVQYIYDSLNLFDQAGQPLAGGIDANDLPLHDEKPTPAAPATRSKSLLQRASRYPAKPSIAVAVVVMVAVLIAMAVTPVSRWIAGAGEKQAEPRQHQAPPGSEYVAILNRRHNAEWLDGTRPSKSDPRLKVGRKLVLASGLIEIKYYTGARVVIEGPTEFWVGSQASGGQAVRHQEDSSRGRKPVVRAGDENSGFLKIGKLVARVEGEEAKGFTINTPHASVEDLGTEFGVEVYGGGDAEVAVLEGEVDVVHEADDDGLSQRVRLVVGQAADVTAASGVIARNSQEGKVLVAAFRHRLARNTKALEQTTGEHVEQQVLSADEPIVLVGYYRLGEGQSVRNAAPFAPLMDSIAPANNIAIFQANGGTTATTTTGLVAPGSTAALQISNNAGGSSGWHDGAAYGMTDNWAMDLWVRPDETGGTYLGASDNSILGIVFHATNTDFEGTTKRGTVLPAGKTYLVVRVGNDGPLLGSTSSTYAAGKWTRLTVIVHNSTVHYYLNGRLARRRRAGQPPNEPPNARLWRRRGVWHERSFR